MTPQQRRQLQRLMQDPAWPTLEEYFQKFMQSNFLDTSAKKDTEWDTVWYIAFNEGGKHFLRNFMQALEEEAMKYNEEL